MEVSHIKNTAGFTLLELIFVLLIMSIISVTVMLQWTASGIDLGAQAKELASDIRYTQSLAMTNGQRYYLIKQSSTTYQIMTSGGTAVMLFNGRTTATLNSGITFGTLTNLPNNLVAFDGKGTPYTTSSSPGTALTSTATIPITSGGATKTISIQPGTGRVTIS